MQKLEPLKGISNNQFNMFNFHEDFLGAYNPRFNYIVLDEKVSEFYKFIYTPLRKNNIKNLIDTTFIDFSETRTEVIEKTDKDIILSYGTYLHELYHSIQFYGSSLGFISILSNSAQGALMAILRSISDTDLVKPLYMQEQINNIPEVNHIVNTFFDIEFAVGLIFYPDKAEEIFKSPWFESTGHSYRYLYQESLMQLEQTFEYKNKWMSYYKDWKEEFKQLEAKKEPMYFFKSAMLYNIFGLQDIVEGQARFQEIQYIYSMNKEDNDWEKIKKRNLLEPMYTKVFAIFLTYLELDFPDNPLSKVVNCFLLVCDIAINPTVGYPDPIIKYEKFVTDVNPYCRFMECLSIIKKDIKILDEFENISGEVYWKVTDYILGKLNKNTIEHCWNTIVDNSNYILGIQEIQNKYIDLMYDDKNCKNILNEYYYMSHVNLIRKKIEHPEFYCWMGQYIAGESDEFDTKEILELIGENSPMFISLKKNEALELNNIHSHRKGYEKFASYFFDYQTFIDLERQLVTQRGKFRFNYPWNQFNSEEKFKESFNGKFKLNTNRNLDDFILL